ncbi:dTDP-4-dehydrorhamnose reductase [Nitrobacteraceae bacterium AZCC 1564]
MALPKHRSESSWADGPIFVAGKSGQLARCLQELAVKQTLPLVAFGRPEFDLSRDVDVEQVITGLAPAAIINAAAYTMVDQAEVEPEVARAINRDGAARLAAVARSRNIPFVHISTDYVFDGAKLSPYNEEDQSAPLNVYGRSKYEGEVAVFAAHPHAVVIRTSWVYSPYGHNFVRTMLRLAATQATVRVVNDQRGTPTSASDLAAAVLEIVRQLRADRFGDKSGIYHLAGRGEASWSDFAEAIFASLTRRGQRVPTVRAITTEDYPTPARRPRNSCLDSTKAHRTFRVQLAPWQESVERCLDHIAAPVGSPAC